MSRAAFGGRTRRAPAHVCGAALEASSPGESRGGRPLEGAARVHDPGETARGRGGRRRRSLGLAGRTHGLPLL